MSVIDVMELNMGAAHAGLIKRQGMRRGALCSLFVFATAVVVCLLMQHRVAHAQTPLEQQKQEAQREVKRREALQNRRPQGGQPRIVRPNPARLQEQQQARNLLRMMLRPTAPYIATQETVMQNSGGTKSIQDVEGDSRGFVRIQFRLPKSVEGDVMIIGPQSFHSFHRSRNLVEVALWPTEWNDEGKRMLANLLNGSVSARMVGTETIAGRSAGIVELSVVDGAGEGRVLRKLWIDQQTGILMRIQKTNPGGQITSTTTVLDITVSPTTPINPVDFRPQFAGAAVTPLFPDPQYRSMLEAQGHLPFQPLEPPGVSLPGSFKLDGVWGFGMDRLRPNQGSVLLRYTDGVVSFCLFERIVQPGKVAPERPRPASFARNQQTWRFTTAQGEVMVQYIGHLRKDQAEAVYEALH